MKVLEFLLLLALWPLRWLKRQLARELRLRIDGRRLRLVLETPAGAAENAAPATPPAAAPIAPTAAAPDEGPSQMQLELHRLLGQHRQARHLMRHLGYVERSLGLAGADALDQLPLDVLVKASAQLEQLVTDWSAPGLAELRLRLGMAIADQEEAAKHFQPTNSALSDFDTPHRLQVMEGSESQFRAVEEVWKKP
jgi:hypothetical protein